jgi:hypothetical protein
VRVARGARTEGEDPDQWCKRRGREEVGERKMARKKKRCTKYEARRRQEEKRRKGQQVVLSHQVPISYSPLHSDKVQSQSNKKREGGGSLREEVSSKRLQEELEGVLV